MAGQTQMNGKPSDHRAAADFRTGVGDLLHDVLTLAELQAQLVAVDFRESRSHSVVPLLMILSGAILALNTVPVLLLGIGWGLINVAGLSESLAFSLTAVTSLSIAVALTWTGWRKLRSALATLSRSQQEFKSNVCWIKEALRRRSSST